MSQESLKFEYPITPLNDVKESSEEVRVRAYVHNIRSTGKSAFFVLRQGLTTLQAITFGDKNMAKYAGTLPKESYVEIHGKIVKAE